MNPIPEIEASPSAWKNRTTLVIPKMQMKRLAKGKMAQVMKDRRWYELRVQSAQPVYDHKGIELTKAQLRSILRKM
jgi:hypothetical protein